MALSLATRSPSLVLDLRGGYNPLAQIGSAYAASLASKPLATNIATAAALSFVGDGIAQITTSSTAAAAGNNDAFGWDKARSVWILVWGAVVSGYLLSFWFAFLGRLFPEARTSWKQLVGKVCTNQIFLSPGLNGGFFAFVILTRNRPVARFTKQKWTDLKRKWVEDLLPTCMRSTAYWSVVQTLNFRVFPDSVTVLSSNLFFVVWTVYLSIIGNRATSPNENDDNSNKLNNAKKGV